MSLVFQLDKDHLDAVHRLHQEVLKGLGPEEKTFILPRDDNYFEHYLEGANGNVTVGIEDDGVIVAKAIIIHPHKADTPQGLIIPETIDQDRDSLSVIQSITVAQAARGRGYMKEIIEYWINHALEFDRSHLFAEIHVENKASISAFKKFGLDMVGVTKSPLDGAPVYNAQEKISGERLKYAALKEIGS